MPAEDKDLGVKVAVNPLEALWMRIVREAEDLIKMSENNLIVQKAMKEMAEGKLKEISG
jgi:hypothetical protein